MIKLESIFFKRYSSHHERYAIPIGALSSPFSERVFSFFNAIAADIAVIYPAGGKLSFLLVFIIDSNLLFCFYGSVATANTAILPPGGRTLSSSIISIDD